MFLVVKENLPTQKLPIFSAGAQRAVDVVVAAKHVSDAILGVRGIGLGRVTKRRGGGGGGREREGEKNPSPPPLSLWRSSQIFHPSNMVT